MARQTGMHTFQGKLGTTRGFRMKQLEGWFEGMLGGADKNTILTAPEFVRTRENMSEFAGSALAGKRFRNSFGGYPQAIADVIFTGRTLALMEKILHFDTVNPRGQRTIDFFANSTELVGYEMNRFRPFTSMAAMPFTATQTVTELTIVVPAFLPTDYLDIPAGATHFVFIYNSQTLSNYEYDVNGYIPSTAAGNGSFLNNFSAPIDLFTLTTAINEATTQPVGSNGTDQVSIGSFGIIFFQQIGADYYRLQQNSAMTVVGVAA